MSDEKVYKVNLNDINAEFTCPLCQGYLIDCTTAVQCGHIFCRSCILRHIARDDIANGHLACPQCNLAFNDEDIQKPLHKLRTDDALQRLIYKLVPGLLASETERRTTYLQSEKAARKEIKLSVGDDAPFYNDRSVICTELVHIKPDITRKNSKSKDTACRFLRAEMSAQLSVLQEFIKLRMSYPPQTTVVFSATLTFIPIPASFRVIDLAYLSKWDRARPLQIFYKVLDNSAQKQEIAAPAVSSPEPVPTSTAREERQQSLEIEPPSQPPRRITDPSARVANPAASDNPAKLKLKFNRKFGGRWRVASDIMSPRKSASSLSQRLGPLPSPKPSPAKRPTYKPSPFFKLDSLLEKASSSRSVDEMEAHYSGGRKRLFVDLRDTVKSSKVAKVLPFPALPAERSSQQQDELISSKDNSSSILYSTGLVPANHVSSQRDASVFSIQQILNGHS